MKKPLARRKILRHQRSPESISGPAGLHDEQSNSDQGSDQICFWGETGSLVNDTTYVGVRVTPPMAEMRPKESDLHATPQKLTSGTRHTTAANFCCQTKKRGLIKFSAPPIARRRRMSRRAKEKGPREKLFARARISMDEGREYRAGIGAEAEASPDLLPAALPPQVPSSSDRCPRGDLNTHPVYPD
jgi:hypothetical protein